MAPMPYKDPDKQKAFSLAWQKKRREDWFLENGPCRECQSWNRLELDHIDPSTKISHNIWSWRYERRTEELRKCQPLCHDCHKKKTSAFNRARYSLILHGSSGGYGRGCRCDKCSSWQKSRMDKYHADHPRRKNFKRGDEARLEAQPIPNRPVGGSNPPVPASFSDVP